MKKFRRILSFIVAMAMIMSMSTLCFLVTAEGGESEQSIDPTAPGGYWAMGNEFAIGEVGSTATLESGCFALGFHDNGYDVNNEPYPLNATVTDVGGVASLVSTNPESSVRAFSKSATGIIDVNAQVGSPLVYFKAPVDGTYYYEVEVTGAFTAEGVQYWAGAGVRDSLNLADNWIGTPVYAGLGNTATHGNAHYVYTQTVTVTAGQLIVFRPTLDGGVTEGNVLTINKFNVYRTSDGDSFAYDEENPAKVNGNFALGGSVPGTGAFDPLADAPIEDAWAANAWYGSGENSGTRYFATAQGEGSLIDLAPVAWVGSEISYTAPAAGKYDLNAQFVKRTTSGMKIEVAINRVYGESFITESLSSATTFMLGAQDIELKQGDQLTIRVSNLDGSPSNEVGVNFLNVFYLGHDCEEYGYNDDGTCLTGATCVFCGETTGALNPNNHEAEATAYVDNGDGTHTVSYDDCCQTPAIESHDFTTGGTCSKDGCGATLNAENEDYVISFNPYGDKEVNNEDTVAVELQISGTATHYASGKIVVYYDANVFTFEGATGTLSDVTVDSNENGKLVIVMYGEDHELTEELQTFATLTFKAKSLTAPESSDIVLGEAGFSTQTLAETEDLTPAIKYYSTLTVTVNARVFDVALDEDLAGDGTATEGTEYTFTPETVTGSHYDYSNLVVMVDDDNDGVAEKDITAEVTKTGDTWTIPGDKVTGQITVTVDRTPKTFNVTVVDDEGNDVSGTWIVGFTTPATYGTDYTFEVIPDTWTNVAGGIKYEVALTIGGVDATADRAGQIYTITGTNVTGDIAIVITDASYEATGVDVVLTGPGTTGNATFAPFGQDYKFTVDEEEGYVYTISYKVGAEGTVMTPALVEGQYVVPMAELTDTVYVTVTRVEDKNIVVYEYLTLNNGYKLYLVLNDVDKLEGSHFTMNGEAMFWSERYGAYCYLVVSDTVVDAAVAEAYTYAVATGVAVDVDYGMDVNKSEKMDANDAQLVYNMYTAEYEGITANVTVEKYLRADVSADVDYKVDTADASAIANACLN